MKTFPYPTLVALAVFTGPAAFATTLSPEAALQRALSSPESHRAPSKIRAQYTLGYTADDAVYVFDADNGGYLVVPSDDAAPAILGYSDAEAGATMPPAMRWWLDEYARQIKASDGRTRVVPRAVRNPIAPMVSTRWNQNAPFNDLCPMDGTARSVTGCVATALAQVMKYHNWPPQGQGSHSYKSQTLNQTVSCDFASITFDWDAMQDRYEGGNSDSEADQAVAELMFACGVGVDMNYTSNESGSQPTLVPGAMYNYFNYDQGVRYYDRDYYGLVDWEDLVYSQLVNFGPVQYNGQSNQGGHSFVCDGYSQDGYFHINWGWGGMSDGYFLLTALDPGQQGIGGSTSGFNYYQSFIGDVCRPKADSHMYINMLMAGPLSVSQSTASLGGYITVMGNTYNYSFDNVTATMGIKLVDKANGTIQYLEGSKITDIKPQYGIGGYYVALPRTLTAGDYVLTPALLTPQNTWQDVPVKMSGTTAIDMTVQGNTAYFTAQAPANIEATDMNVLTEIYLGESFRMTATLTNSGDSEYVGVIVPALVNASGTAVALADYMAVDIVGGDSQPLDYIGAFTRYTGGSAPAPGTYELYLLDSNTGQAISAPVEVTVYAEPSSTSITVRNLKVDGDANDVDAKNVSFSATVRCSTGYLGGSLTIAIFPYSTGSVSAVASVSSDPIFISSGESATLTAKGEIPGATPGATYMAAAFKGQTQVSKLITFTIGDGGSSAIESVDADNTPRLLSTITDGPLAISGEPTAITVYTLSGTVAMRADKVEDANISTLVPGMYIVEMTYGPDNTQRVINRVIRR